MDKSLPFGKFFTDHMLEIEWDSEKGFGYPTLSPHHNLSLDPAVPALHYAVQCFEGYVVGLCVCVCDRARTSLVVCVNVRAWFRAHVRACVLVFMRAYVQRASVRERS